jgi:hypothetical protein
MTKVISLRHPCDTFIILTCALCFPCNAYIMFTCSCCLDCKQSNHICGPNSSAETPAVNSGTPASAARDTRVSSSLSPLRSSLPLLSFKSSPSSPSLFRYYRHHQHHHHRHHHRHHHHHHHHRYRELAPPSMLATMAEIVKRKGNITLTPLLHHCNTTITPQPSPVTP